MYKIKVNVARVVSGTRGGALAEPKRAVDEVGAAHEVDGRVVAALRRVRPRVRLRNYCKDTKAINLVFKKKTCVLKKCTRRAGLRARRGV